MFSEHKLFVLYVHVCVVCLPVCMSAPLSGRVSVHAV